MFKLDFTRNQPNFTSATVTGSTMIFYFDAIFIGTLQECFIWHDVKNLTTDS